MTELRAIADTNTVLSFYLGKRSLAHHAFSELRYRYKLLASDATLQEFCDVILREKFDRVPRTLRLIFIAEYKRSVILLEPNLEIADCIDAKDNKFLSLAVSGNASLLLTSDRHLTSMSPYRGILILKPEQYLATL